jgi:DNA-binding response OmpR family regulator
MMRAFFQRFTRTPGRLLIVEPNPQEAQALLSLLQPQYRVEIAFTGKKALERLAAFQPEVVMTEIDLPDLSGVELIRTARTVPEQRQIIWIVTTRRNAIADKVASFQAGATDHLVKPLDLQALPALLRNAYRLHQVAQKLVFS